MFGSVWWIISSWNKNMIRNSGNVNICIWSIIENKDLKELNWGKWIEMKPGGFVVNGSNNLVKYE